MSEKGGRRFLPQLKRGGTRAAEIMDALEPASPTNQSSTARTANVKNGQQGTSVNKFDEYKFFIEDTARLSERRQTVTNTYITVSGAIIGLITFLWKDGGFTGFSILWTIAPLLLAGGLICYFWIWLLLSYRKLIGFRFKELQEMEDGLSNSHQMFQRESEAMYAKAPRKHQITLSNIELLLPWAFIGVYVAILVILLLASFNAIPR